MPAGADDPVLLDLAEFLESRYEQAMIKDLTSVITRNMREKRRAANQQHAEVGRVRARATARRTPGAPTHQNLRRRAHDGTAVRDATEDHGRDRDRGRTGREGGERGVRQKKARATVDPARRGRNRTGRGVDGARLRSGRRGSDLRREPGAREIIASATLQVCVPDAPFPPPFPTSRPYRSYLANMAVAPEARRSSVATKVMRASERHEDVGLRRDVAARQHRQSGGAEAVRGDGIRTRRRGSVVVPRQAVSREEDAEMIERRRDARGRIGRTSVDTVDSREMSPPSSRTLPLPPSFPPHLTSPHLARVSSHPRARRARPHHAAGDDRYRKIIVRRAGESDANEPDALDGFLPRAAAPAEQFHERGRESSHDRERDQSSRIRRVC